MPVWEGNLNAKSGYDFLARFDNILKKLKQFQHLIIFNVLERME